MNASSYLIVLLQTTICLSIALFICAIARKSSGVRLIVSQMAIVVSAMILIVCSMVILQVKPIVSVSVPEAVAFTVPITNKVIVPPPRIETTPNQKGDNNLGQVEQRSATNPIYQTTSSFTISKLVSIVYGVGLAFSIFPMALGTWWIRRARKICLGVTAGTAFDVVKSISERHGIRTPRLYAGEAVTIPFVSGLFQKQIFVPLGWVNGPCDVACRAIIEHEVAHVVSRDLERKFLCRLACSLIWFQPLVWIAFRVMANASEELCDQRVLEAGVSNTSYANTLMQIRENAKRSNVPGLVIGAVSRESNLAKRMKLILATDISRIKKVSRLVVWLLASGIVAVAVTSTIAFGQTQQSDPSQNWVSSYSRPISLENHAGKQLVGATAYLVVRKIDETELLIPLPVKDSSAEIPARETKNMIRATLVVQTKTGGQDFKVLWPAKKEARIFKVVKQVEVTGRLIFKQDIKLPCKVMVRALLRENPDIEGGPEFISFEKFPDLSKSVLTDAHGNFHISGVPSNSTVIFDVADDRLAVNSMQMRIKIDADGKFVPLSYEPSITANISGRVFRNGKPVAGITIAAQGQKKHSWSEAVTDENGKYILKRLIPDFYNVAAKLSELEQTEFTVRAKEGIFLKEGEHKTEVNLTVESGGIISGMLTDAKGRPFPDGQIGIYGPAHPRTTAWVQGIKSDSTGRFQTRVPSGLNEVYYMEGTSNQGMIRIEVRDGMESKVQVIGERSDLNEEPNIQNSNPNIVKVDIEKSFGPVTLPDKSSISLMYLCQGQSPTTVVVWRPDGTVDRSSKYLQDLEAVDYFNDPSIGGHIWARIRVQNPLHKASDYEMKGNGSLNPGMWYFTPSVGKNQSDILLQLLPGKPSVGSVKIKVPYGEYSTLYKGEPKGKTYRMVKPINNKQSLQVLLPNESMDHEISIVAKDALGGSTEGWLSSVVQGNDMTGYTYGFSKKILTNTIEVRSRKAQWVTFRGIHLQPTKK